MHSSRPLCYKTKQIFTRRKLVLYRRPSSFYSVNKQHFCGTNQNIELCFYYVRKSFCYTTNFVTFNVIFYRSFMTKYTFQTVSKILQVYFFSYTIFICTVQTFFLSDGNLTKFKDLYKTNHHI